MCKLEAKGARGGWTNQCHHPWLGGLTDGPTPLYASMAHFYVGLVLVYGPMIHVLASGWLRRCYLGLRVLPG
jgi:hypothetical protein